MIRVLLLSLAVFGALFGSSIELSPAETEYLEEKGRITMCVDPDWEPFEIINRKGEHEGVAADLISLVSSRLGIKIELVKTKDWDETIEYSKARKCDLMSFLNDTPKRRSWLVFTDVIFRDPNVLVGRAEMGYIEDIGKMNLTVALPKETSIGERFASEHKNLKIIHTESEREAFRLVEEKKADVTLRSLIVTSFTIKKEGLFNLKIVGEPKGYENLLRIGVRNDEPILRDILNKGIATLSEQDVKNIVNRHVTIVIERVTTLSAALWVVLAIAGLTVAAFVWNYLLKKQIVIEVRKNKDQYELLMKKARQAELAELMANISHQWRNGLAQISATNLDMLIRCDTQKEITKEDARQTAMEIERNIKFLSETIHIFLNFYKDSSLKERFDMSKSIEETLKIIDVKIKLSNANIIVIEHNKVEMDGIKNEWMHIWLNLINNSIDAAIKKGIKQPKITIEVDKEVMKYIDNCGGIESLVLANIKNGVNCGLGIKMSKNILSKYGYSLEIQNTENGAEFRIVI